MEEISLVYENIKPISRNNSHNTYGQKNLQAKEFCDKIQLLTMQNESNRERIKLFDSSYDRKKHYLEAEWFFCYPEKEIITVSGCLKANKFDYDNTAKIPQDQIFKNFKNIDDSYILRGTLWKIPYHCYLIAVRLRRHVKRGWTVPINLARILDDQKRFNKRDEKTK